MYDPGDLFQSLDCKLCVAVDILVKDHANLRNDIMLQTEALAKNGKMIAGRQVLYMVYSYFRTDVENGSVYDIEDIIAVTMYNNNMEHFLQRWDRVLLGLVENIPEKTKKALFISKVKDCPAFRQEYLHYKRMPNDDPCKTYDYLRTAMKEIIETNRREAVREAELRGHAGGNRRGRQEAPAYPANMDTNNGASTRAETPKPTRARRGRSTGRSASPGVRTTSNENRKLGCAFFNRGKGSCRLGDKCAFSHDPKLEVATMPKGKGGGKGKSGKGKGGKRRRGSQSRSASPASRSPSRGGASSRGSTPNRTIDPSRYKTKVCKNYASGSCTFGDRCAFKHEE